MNIVENYPEARALFIDAAENAGFRHMRFRIPCEESPELFQDYALLRRDPRRLLIQISGTHGVEGYLGSAIQRHLLAGTFAEEGPSLLFLHALNPFGMHFYRRANSENVDLNRNFRQGPALPNPDYEYFDSYLNPKSRSEFYAGFAKAFFSRQLVGKARTNQAVAAGQVKHPRGLFYMGERVQREIFLLQEFLRAHGKEAERTVVIDLHSGLGKFGEENLFVDAEIEPSAPAYFEKIFGRSLSAADPKAGFYKNQGPLSDGIRAALPGAVFYVLEEFGAHSPLATLRALREENFEWHQRPPGAERPEVVRRRMLEAFLPADETWRKNCLELAARRWREAELSLS